MISGFRCEVDDNCALLLYDAASDGNSLLSFQETYLTLADGTDRLSQNADKELPLLAAQQSRTAQFSYVDPDQQHT